MLRQRAGVPAGVTAAGLLVRTKDLFLLGLGKASEVRYVEAQTGPVSHIGLRLSRERQITSKKSWIFGRAHSNSTSKDAEELALLGHAGPKLAGGRQHAAKAARCCSGPDQQGCAQDDEHCKAARLALHAKSQGLPCFCRT